MHLRLFYFSFFILIAIAARAQVQTASQYALYTTTEGLSHNSVNDIRQDSTGYIWVATASGLNRFNGNQFVQFHTSSDSLSLPAEELWGASWIDKERLCFFSSGLHIVNTRTGTTKNIFIPYHNKKYQFKFNMVAAVQGDEKGNIYILTRSGFYHFDKNHQLVYRFDYFTEAEVPVKHFHFGSGLFKLNDQQLIIVSAGGLFIYQKGERKFRKMKSEDNPLLAEFLDYNTTRNYQFFQPSPGALMVMKSSSDSILYIDLVKNKKTVSRSPFKMHAPEFAWRTKLFRSNDSLYYITGHQAGFYKVWINQHAGTVKILPEKHFPNYLCTGLLTDRDGQLWIGTNRGLFRSNPQKALIQTARLPEGIENKFPNIRIFDVEVNGDLLYVGTNEGGLFSYDKKNLRFRDQVVSTKYHGTNSVRSISKLEPSTLLLGTHGPLMLHHIASGKQEALIPPQWQINGYWTGDLMNDSKQNTWISSHHLYKYHVPTKKFTIVPGYDKLLDVPFAMAEDRDGHIWFACHGVARYNTITNTYDRYLDSFPYIKMPDKQVGAIAVDRNNTVWFNVNNNGLIGYSIKDGSFRHYTRKDGLPDDNIASLLAIGNKLWIASFSGIACIDIETSKILSYGKEDGFPDMTIEKGSRLFYDSTEQQLYVGFSHAVARFNPEYMLHKKSAPRIFIENMVVKGKQQHYLPGDTLTTSWKDDEILVTIGTINFSDGHSQRFAYSAGDENSPWVDLGSQSSFSISSLKPGFHRIRVKTYSLNNRWTEQVKEMVIYVSPPL